MKKYDHFEMRCPRLGGEVTFSYCRREGGDIPCLRVITCWHSFFPVEQYMKKNMTEDAWNSFVNRIPKDKIITIVELIEEAKKREGQKKANKDNGSL
jgi:hypothetical protein